MSKQAGRDDIVLWQGTCIVHETFSEKKLIELMVQHPDAEVIAHPECEEQILRHLDPRLEVAQAEIELLEGVPAHVWA